MFNTTIQATIKDHARRGVENEVLDLAIYLVRYIRSECLEQIDKEFNSLRGKKCRKQI